MNSQLTIHQARSQHALEKALSNQDVPARLLESMRYSTLAGGKRLRAMLVYASGLAVGANLQQLDSVAAAIECIHSYSLIHDDLPAMDDDDLRRGQASNHIEFDQATAILAADALQALAFELICSAESGLSDHQSRAITLRLATSAGQTGMVGGQMLDILATQKSLDKTELEEVHRRKTGALISSAVICGALCSDNCSPQTLQKLEIYGDHIGLAFQVVDDILDIESSTEVLGKTSGADVALGKATYPALIGLQESKDLAKKLCHDAIVSVASISDNTQHLVELAELVLNRNH